VIPFELNQAEKCLDHGHPPSAARLLWSRGIHALHVRTGRCGMSESEAFDPYSLLNVLKLIAQDVWIVDGPEIRFSYCGFPLPFPTHMTVIRLPDGSL
jgi:hypothetical protein